jgi:hypothetical protein
VAAGDPNRAAQVVRFVLDQTGEHRTPHDQREAERDQEDEHAQRKQRPPEPARGSGGEPPRESLPHVFKVAPKAQLAS